jgi:hypothetical protein
MSIVLTTGKAPIIYVTGAAAAMGEKKAVISGGRTHWPLTRTTNGPSGTVRPARMA